MVFFFKYICIVLTLLCAGHIQAFTRHKHVHVKKQNVLHGQKIAKQQESKPSVNVRDGRTICIPSEVIHQKTPIVKVLLIEEKKHSHWCFFSEKGFTVEIKQENKFCRYVWSKPNLTVACRHGEWYIDGNKTKGTCIIIPHTGFIEFNEKKYKGLFCLTHEKMRALIINQLPLEDYVFCVLKSESWPGWPIEINKVFAIMCRTYALTMMVRAKKNNKLYHLKNTNAHQTYHGVHSCSIIKAAVDQTAGMFLAYNQAPILAMFDSCCGGIIPAHIADFDFAQAPYLARPYACAHCRQLRIYSWQATYDAPVFENMMKTVGVTSALRNVKVASKDKAGLAQEVVLTCKHGKVVTTGQKLYSLVKDIKSFCFDISKKSNMIIIKGRGYGHHLGLCQWGAREMVKEGWNYKRILQFYYPGTTFMNIA